MTSIPARAWNTEADKQTAAVLAERARLCDPLRLQHDQAALNRIMAWTAALKETRAWRAIPLTVWETGAIAA